MVEITLHLDDAAAQLYRRLACHVGLPLEQVLSDALFLLAGELAAEALSAKRYPTS